MDIAVTLMTLGGIVLLGFVTDLIGQVTPLPRVSLLLLLGFALGPSGLACLPDLGPDFYALVAHMALVMVGFLVGGTLKISELAENGVSVLWFSWAIVLVTIVVVALGLVAMGIGVVSALLLAAVATATDPGATMDTVKQARASGRFAQMLLAVVALDDAWGLIAFSVLLAVAQSMSGASGALEALSTGAWELCGAILLGVAIGLPMAWVTGRITPGEPTQAEAVGSALLCAGLAEYLGVSFVLAAIVMGFMVGNFAHHHRRPFHEIEGIAWPFMIIFFVLGGARLEVSGLLSIAPLLLAYVVFRVVGRVLGGVIAHGLTRGAIPHGQWLGLALLPQAGIALGIAIAAAEKLPQTAAILLPVTLAATVCFEVLGPFITRFVLLRSIDAARAEPEREQR